MIWEKKRQKRSRSMVLPGICIVGFYDQAVVISILLLDFVQKSFRFSIISDFYWLALLLLKSVGRD
jgi:hypothetical protein